jgi:twitching motility protein PilT
MDTEMLLKSIATPELMNTFNTKMELDFTHDIPGLARFRVNALRQRGTISLCFRMIPMEIPSIDDLGLPKICKELALKPRGLILITGPTGSGKSTTVAAIIDHLNENEARNIITIEDPIEYVYSNKKCLIAQRDVGHDTQSFDAALVHALRHDPDVIVVGEMRDMVTISIAIRAAETGHMVISTLHTTDAAQTVDRIIDVFPPDQQQQIRLQLSQVLEAIISQTLLPRIDGGRIGAFEIMMANPAVRNLIRDKKTFELPNVIQLNGNGEMQTLDDALSVLVGNGLVSLEEAVMKSSHPERLRKSLQY